MISTNKTSTNAAKYRGVTMSSYDCPIYWMKDDDTVIKVIIRGKVDLKLKNILDEIFKDSYASVNIR